MIYASDYFRSIFIMDIIHIFSIKLVLYSKMDDVKTNIVVERLRDMGNVSFRKI